MFTGFVVTVNCCEMPMNILNAYESVVTVNCCEYSWALRTGVWEPRGLLVRIEAMFVRKALKCC
jgi:hypothetical protein